MSTRSLRLRLLLIAFAGIAIAIVLAGAGLVALFERHIERRIGLELDAHIGQIAGNVRAQDNGTIFLAREPADPRFSRVFSGLYWQVLNEADGTLIASHSLWDERLTLPDDTLAVGAVDIHKSPGPNNSELLVHERRIAVDLAGQPSTVRISVAISMAELGDLKEEFGEDIVPALVVLGLLLIAGLWLQVGAGLKPLDHLRSGIAGIRAGQQARLDTGVPEEVAPLVGEVNSLLDAQEAAMQRARDKAADLAHGLKTPLAALKGDVKRLRALGQDDIASDIETAAELMHRHVERELARSRMRHGSGTLPAVPLAEIVPPIIETIKRTPFGEDIEFEVEIDPAVAVRVARDDLFDVLGNLLENAARHGRGKVRIHSKAEDSDIVITIEDDGEGIAPEQADSLSRRGQRLDESGEGAGLGLAITGDILAEYGIALEILRSPLGGAMIRFRLPA